MKGLLVYFINELNYFIFIEMTKQALSISEVTSKFVKFPIILCAFGINYLYQMGVIHHELFATLLSSE